MGTLHSVDQYLNLKLTDVSTQDEEKYPHLMSVKTCFIRGSVVRYVHINKADVNIELLQDSARVEAKSQKEAVSKVP
jgi:U6 snRNA-associated Sm-like protein LSm2